MDSSFDLEDFFDQEAYSDITISYGTKQLKAHKIIICSKSDYFKKLCGPGSALAESTKHIIELKDDDEDAVMAMFKWLYSFEYEHCITFRPRIRHSKIAFDMHTAVYVVADKYQITALSELAKRRAEAFILRCDNKALIDITRAKLQGNDDRYPAFVTDLLKGERSKRLPKLLYIPFFLGLLRHHTELAMEVIYSQRNSQNAKKVHAGECTKCTKCNAAASNEVASGT